MPAVQFREPTIVDDDTSPDFLAWGGESGDEFSLVSVADIRKDFTQAHYSGHHAWDQFALLGLDGAGDAVAFPVSIKAAPDGNGSSRWIDENDYIHQAYEIVTPGGYVAADFTTRIDGRA